MQEGDSRENILSEAEAKAKELESTEWVTSLIILH